MPTETKNHNQNIERPKFKNIITCSLVAEWAFNWRARATLNVIEWVCKWGRGCEIYINTTIYNFYVYVVLLHKVSGENTPWISCF